MSVLAWIVIIAVIWLAVAAVVGVIVGRAIRLRDRQVQGRFLPVLAARPEDAQADRRSEVDDRATVRPEHRRSHHT